MESLVKKNKWPLDMRFNKIQCVFKAGFFNAFGIKWTGRKSFAFFFKISERDAKAAGIPMGRYEPWKEAVYFVDAKTRIADFRPLFELAYKRRSGE